jgi:hypothetical protein
LDFESPDLIFDWLDNRELDPATASTIRVNEVKAGIMSADEAREDRGENPLGGAFAVPMAYTATGYVAIKSPEEQDAASEASQQAMRDAAQARAPKPQDEHAGVQENDPKAEGNNKDGAEKLGKGLKKKPNPYLLTSRHRH